MAAAAAASLCCSIETEPRTLSEGQLSQARETAGDIARKFQPQVAEFIFTEGFDETFEKNQRERGIGEGIVMSITNEKARIMEKPCQCTLADPLENSSST